MLRPVSLRPVSLRPVALAGSVLTLVSLVTAQKPTRHVPPEAPSTVSGAKHTGLRHEEGLVTPFPLPLLPTGPDGSLMRENIVYGQFDGPTVVAEDFESGALGANWTTWSSTASGRIQLTGDYGSGSGDHALLMDTAVTGYNLNEAIWTVDLRGAVNPRLLFWSRRVNDENHPMTGDFTGHLNADGVAISDDGIRWHPIGQAFYTYWNQSEVDLTAAAAAAGMTLGAGFQIKFQQYDDFPLTTDGIGYDGIGIHADGVDFDTYEVSVDPGQKITVRMEPPWGVTGYVRIHRGNQVLAEALGEPGTPVLLSSVALFGTLGGGGDPRTYQITVSNVVPSFGSYYLTVALNTEFERESTIASENDQVASAEDLNRAFVPLHSSVKANTAGRKPMRAAVRGQGGTRTVYSEDFENGSLGSAWTTSSSTPDGRIEISSEASASGAYSLWMDVSTGSDGGAGAFYEIFPAPGSLDLAANLTLTNQGSNYQVTQGTGTFQTPVSGSLTAGSWEYSSTGSWDDAHTYPIALPASWGSGFPYPGGVTQSITIGSNGYVFLQPSDYSYAFYNDTYNFHQQAPRLAAAFGDWDPSTGGSMHYDVGPGDAWVAITWLGVPEWPQPGTSVTFQMVLYPSGQVDLNYQGSIDMVLAPVLVGFNPAMGTVDDGSMDLDYSLPFTTRSVAISAMNRNEADWLVDLSQVSRPRLSFYCFFWNDEWHPFAGPFTGHADADGVAISVDGVNWYPLDVQPYQSGYDIDLTQVATSFGITLGNNVRIRFQQFDNAPRFEDGIGWDIIAITGDDQDLFKVRINAGDTLAMYATGTGVDLDLLDAGQNVVARRLRDPIVNGSFEEGFNGWDYSYSGGYPYYSWTYVYAGWGSLFAGAAPASPQHGYYSAINSFDMYGSYGPGPYEHTLAQTITLPNPLPGLLRWSDRIQWDFTQWGDFASLPRSYTVEVRDPVTDALLATLHSFATGTQATTPTGDTGWLTHTADLSAFAGTTVRLVFRETIPEVYTGPGQFELDNVRFLDLPSNVDSVVAPFSAPATGDYYVRVAAASSYDLLVLENARFGLESNDTIATASPIGTVEAAGRKWVVGHAGAGGTDVDYYRLRGTVGHTLVLETMTPAGGEGSFVNDLDPELHLYDAAGNQVAYDDNSASDGRNARIDFPVPTTADYFVKIGVKTTHVVDESFETGALGAMWTTSSTTTNGRIRVTNLGGAAQGSYALLMDVATNVTGNVTNSATMTVDLSGLSSAKLTFAHASFNDLNQGNDGVYISANGTTFYKVWSPPFQASGVWQTYTLDLAALAVNFGLTLGPNFKIRFQQIDNRSFPVRGRAWDAISIDGTKPAGEYMLTVKGEG